MQVRIREARPTDAPRIAEIHVDASQSAFRGLMPEAELEKLSAHEMACRWAPLTLTLNGGFFVAEADELLGFCSVTPARGESFRYRTAEIMALYVAPDRQSSGVGTKLINATLDHAHIRGFTEIMLWVLPGNEQARQFYESFGFHSDGMERTGHGLRTTVPLVEYRLSLLKSAAERARVRDRSRQSLARLNRWTLRP